MTQKLKVVDEFIHHGPTGQPIEVEAIVTDNLPDGGVTTAKLANNSVTADKIAPGAVVAADITRDVINKTGSPIAIDKLVAIVDLDVTSGKPKIVLADADVAGHEDVWVTTAEIDDDAEGVVAKSALSTADLNTNAVGSAGDPVFLSTTAGGFTVTAPTGASARVIPVGMVVVKSATVGQILWLVGPTRKIGSDELQDDSVIEAKILNDAVTTDKILDGAVTAAKLDSGLIVASGALLAEDLGTPDLSVDDRFLLSVNMQATPYTLDQTTLPAGNPPRNIIITHADGATRDTLGSAVIDGTDVNDAVIQETIVIVGGAVATGVKAFKTVTAITTAGWVIDGVESTPDTIKVGFGDLLGLSRVYSADAKIFLASLDNTLVAPDGVTTDPTLVEENTIDLSGGSYDGSKEAKVLTIS